MVITAQDFVLEMGMNPFHIVGIPVENDTSCGALTCAQINKMVADLAWAESTIDSALMKYGLSLYYQEKTFKTDAPYFWKKGGMVPGKLETVNVTATVVVEEDGETATITIPISSDDFDPDCDEVVQVIFKETCAGLCPKKLQPKWRELNQPVAVGDNFEITLVTDVYSITECACDGSGCAELEEINLDVVILKPSAPRMGSYATGCDPVETTCAMCGGYSTVDGCIVNQSDRMITAEFDLASCGCNGVRKIYEFDMVIPPLEYNSQMWNAIISLANTRKALLGCELCSPESQERIKFDLGILSDGGVDQRAKAPYLFNNPFGVFAPGALAAWRVVSDKVSGMGGAGHF